MNQRRDFLKKSAALAAGSILSPTVAPASVFPSLATPAINPVSDTYALTAENSNDLMGYRFLTFNTLIRVNQVEASRTLNIGYDERELHTPERIKSFREAIEAGFPGARITWAFSWLALHDMAANYRKIREMVANYHRQYGDDVTFNPSTYYANVYNSIEQVNRDLHDGLAKVSEMVGNGFRPQSVVAGFLAAPNLQYLVEKEGIHVCQGTIWSQFSIDNQDGDGSVSYPYYPSKEHYCKPAQGEEDFIDCVNLDGWSMDFLAARRNGYADGFNSRMGVGPIETTLVYGKLTGLLQMMHTTAIHFDSGFEMNGFAWVPNAWEISLSEGSHRGQSCHGDHDFSGIIDWLDEVKRRWPDVRVITQGEFGLIWRKHYKDNSFNYRFAQRGSGIGGSDANKRIRWFMNKHFRLALLQNWQTNRPEEVIDFTRYDVKAQEPQTATRHWSLMGEINQKQTRPQDKPVPLRNLPEEYQQIIQREYPYLFR